MQGLPPVIRTYLAEGKYTTVARNLTAKYGLRIDQAGVLERELMLLLMGIENPEEFTQALLEEAQLDQKTINSLSQDVNEQVFIPLRKEEENKGVNAPQSAIPAAEPTRPVTSRLQNKIPTPNKGSLTSVVKPVSNIAPLPPKVVMPRVVRMTGTLGDAVRLALSTEKQPEASKLLEDHEEPHMELKKEEVAPENLPGVMLRPAVASGEEGSPIATEIRPAFVVPPKVAPVAPAAQVAPIKSYSTDPYREPVDEVPGS